MDQDGVAAPKGSRDLAPTLHGVDFVLCGISTVFTILRVFTRIVVTKDFGVDDYAAVLSICLVWVGKALVTMEVVYGLGRHKAAVSIMSYKMYLKYDLVDWAQTILVLAVSKLAICFFLLRLTQFHRLRYAIWVLITFIVLSHIPFIVLLLLRCKPINKYWNEEIPGTCSDKTKAEIVIIVQGVCSIFIDCICAACPIVLLHNAKIKRKVKIQLCLLMGFGFLTAIACCVRTGFSYQTKSDDMSWVSVPNSIARMFEVNMGVCAACAPMMKPFARYMRAKYFRGDSRILHNSMSTISFWHRSWWKPSASQVTDDGGGRIGRTGRPNRTGGTGTGEDSKESKRNNRNGTGEDSKESKRNSRIGIRRIKGGFRIPSLALGDDFQDRIMDDSRLDTQVVEEMYDELEGATLASPREKPSWPSDLISPC